MSPHILSESKDASIQGQFAAQEQNCSNSYFFFFFTMYGNSCHLNEQLAVYDKYPRSSYGSQNAGRECISSSHMKGDS